MSAERAMVVVPTHLPRYLDIVLAGLGRQTRRPDRVVVTCDTDDQAIGRVIGAWADRIGLEIWWVRRPAEDGERLCQVRNNAVRWLVDGLGETSGRIIVLDGDMLANADLVRRHLELAGGRELVYPYRIDLTREQSEALDAERILRGEQTLEAEPVQAKELARRHRRYVKQRLMRALGGATFGGRAGGLAPLHKPKLLGGHFSVTLELYLRLNGFDELYQGWGFKDDEFAYRAARLGAKVRVAVKDIVAWHLWHPTRQPEGPMRDLPNARRFERRRELPLAAEHGVINPLPQGEVRIDRFGPREPTRKMADPVARPAGAV